MPVTSPARDVERSGPGAITPGAGRLNRMSADDCAKLCEGAPVVAPGLGGSADSKVAGGQALGTRASDRVDAILAGHAVPPPVPEAASAELREIVARAEARAGL